MKRKYLKTFFAVALCVALVFVLASCDILDGVLGLVFPEDDGEKVITTAPYFNSNGDGTCKVRGLQKRDATHLVIPEVSPDGDTVTEIDDAAFEWGLSLRNVTIPNTVTRIGSKAFDGCLNLTNISIGSGVVSITEDTFDGCNYLESITIDENNPKFKDVDGKVMYTKSGEDIVLYAAGLDDTSFTIPDGVKYISPYAFSAAGNLKSINIPSTVSSIGKHAFGGCTGLMDISIPKGILRIEEGAFAGCRSFTSVAIPDSVRGIGDYAFSECDGLVNVTIPSSVTSIGAHAFENCTGLNSVSMLNGVAEIGEYAFKNCDGLMIINMPDSITSIGTCAFASCDNFTSVTIPQSVTSVGKGIFSDCPKLIEIINNSQISNNHFKLEAEVVHSGPSYIVEKDGYLFYTQNGNDYLVAYAGADTVLTLPENYDGNNYGIHSYAFYNLSGITSVTIPDSVTLIGEQAFAECSNLMSVIIGDGVSSIGSQAFSDCMNLTSIDVSAANTVYKSIDGNLYTKDGETLIQYAIGKTAARFDIPEGVTRIGSYAFYGCGSFTSVVIPEGVTVIGRHAFQFCDGLTSATIPDSVSWIGEYAFYNCNNLTAVNYRGSEEQWDVVTKEANWDPWTATVVCNYTEE